MSAARDLTPAQSQPTCSAEGVDTGSNALVQVRELLLGGDPNGLRVLKRILDDPKQRVQFVSSVLSEALVARSERDDSVARALSSSIDVAIEYSVRNNPKPLIDAVFPIIGPAIRKSLTEALNQMLAGLNHALENKFSLRALHWRIEAYRSGKSYAEVVLLRNLVYQVEQVLLIHNESGLLIAEAKSADSLDKDASLVSAMLTAIRDFIADSFDVEEDSEIQSTKVGECTLLVERGPHATVAALVRGTPPVGFRTTLTETLEALHRLAGSQLASFDGNQNAFTYLEPQLAACLLKQGKDVPRGNKGMWRLWLLGFLVVGGLFYFGVNRYLETRAFQLAVERLSVEPGLVIVDAKRDGAGYSILGLRDALSVDPEALVRAVLPNSIEIGMEWKSYVSVEPKLVLKRAINLFNPPDTVALEFNDGRLIVTGSAEAAWVQRIAADSVFVPGVIDVDVSKVTPVESVRFEELKRSIEAVSVFFDSGSAELVDSQLEQLAKVTLPIKQLIEDARVLARHPVIYLLGSTDNTGSPNLNQTLSELRAERTKAYFVAQGFPDDMFEVRSVQSNVSRAAPEPEKADLARFRRVDFRVFPTDLENAGKP